MSIRFRGLDKYDITMLCSGGVVVKEEPMESGSLPAEHSTAPAEWIAWSVPGLWALLAAVGALALAGLGLGVRLVVLCSEQATQQVVNAGSLYQ